MRAVSGESISDLVRRGYDEAADRYLAGRDLFASRRFLDRFIDLVPPPATVLDVGCGAGVPIDRSLVDAGYDVVGIDISARQIELARERVPEARFEVRDMLELQESEFSMDGAVTRGPAVRALEHFQVEVVSGAITIHGDQVVDKDVRTPAG